jgi:hypothetical protein
MPMFIYTAIFLCAAGVAVAVAGIEPAVRLPSPMMMVERRRAPYWRMLAVVGRLIFRSSRQPADARGRLIYTGSRVTVEEFGGIKLMTALLGGTVGLSLVQELGVPPAAGVLLGGVIGLVAPDLWRRARVAKRQKAIVLRQASVASRLRVKQQIHDKRITDTMLRMEQYEGKIERMEAELESYDLGGKTLADEFTQMESGNKVEAELEQLRSKLGKPKTTEPPTKK